MITLIFVVSFAVGTAIFNLSGSEASLTNPLGNGRAKRELPYEKYSFERLAERKPAKSEISYQGDKFYYYSEGRRISGEIHKPEGQTRGIVVMARGYVEKEEYKTGVGTKNAAAYYSSQGYLTYAPDFSGYGESDPEDENALGARLTKPVEILDLLSSLDTTLPIYLWGHSNGGQIMLSVAEVIGMSSYTYGDIRGLTLWAPVSKPFPYNILYYTDEADDRGKWLRSEIAKFEEDYDVYKYSIDMYLDKITLPLQLHQGTVDDSVPKKWSDELAKSLEEKYKELNYYTYQGADHNMRPSWNTVVTRDVSFFSSNF